MDRASLHALVAFLFGKYCEQRREQMVKCVGSSESDEPKIELS